MLSGEMKESMNYGSLGWKFRHDDREAVLVF
jgi:hypothetical protein